MKTYSQFTEFLFERVQWQRSLFDHLFYDADKLLDDDNYQEPSYDEDDEDDEEEDNSEVEVEDNSEENTK